MRFSLIGASVMALSRCHAVMPFCSPPGELAGAQCEFLGDGAVRIECFLNMPQQFLVADQGPHFAPFQLFFLKEFFGQRISQHDVSGWTDE